MPHVAAAQSAPPARRILVIANTLFEADGLVAALLTEGERHPDLPAPGQVAPHPTPSVRAKRDSDVTRTPRCILHFRDQGGRAATIEVWCLYDMMSAMVSGSNSDEKALALRQILSLRAPADGVIAFGTGAFPSEESRNGCVAVGSSVFVHDAKGGYSLWSWPGQMEKVVKGPNPLNEFYSSIAADQALRAAIEAKMKPAVERPAPSTTMLISADAVAVSSVNIASPADYVRVDREAVELAKAAGAATITSVETTHGVIRRYCDVPFIHVTGIPNRMGFFSTEGDKNNMVASRNAGIVAGWLLPAFMRSILP